MFFNKTETEDKTPISHPDEAVYILGTNTLAIYLAAKFSENGEYPIILGSTRELENIQHEFTIKDERFINRQKYTPRTACSISLKAKALIITAESSRIKSQLITILPNKLSEETPILLFTILKDTSFISECLKQPLIKSYYHGCLGEDKNNISIIGRQNNIYINSTAENKNFSKINALFRENLAKTIFIPNETDAFWNYLAPHATISLLSAAHGKNIYYLTKDETSRQEMDSVINEIQKIAQKHKTNLEHTDILKTIYNIPSSYVSPLQNALNSGDIKEIDNFSDILSNLATKSKISTPTINHLLNLIYNKTLV